MTNIETTEVSEADFDEGNYVAVDRDELDALVEKADRAEDLDERLDDVDDTLESLAEHRELMEDVDEDALEQLREYDAPVVLTEDEHAELTDLVDSVGEIYADELAEYGPFDSEELQERFDPLELKEKVEEHDEASVEDELGESEPEPEGGSAEDEELTGEGGEDTGADEADEEELREHVAESLEDEGWNRQARKVRDGDIPLEEIVERYT